MAFSLFRKSDSPQPAQGGSNGTRQSPAKPGTSSNGSQGKPQDWPLPEYPDAYENGSYGNGGNGNGGNGKGSNGNGSNGKGSNGKGSKPPIAPAPPAPPVAPGASKGADMKQKFNKFLGSLENVLADLTALEVNTMVVTQISGEKFNALRAYRDLYALGIESKEDPRYQDIQESVSIMPDLPEKLWDSYRKIYAQLTDCYHQCCPEDTQAHRPLPPPDSPQEEERERLNTLVQDSQFLRTLRKLFEQKVALDGGDVHSDAVTDLIYAQTVIQLDGDVINRYHRDLLEQKDLQEFVLRIHNQAVADGERQWRGLINLMVELLQKVADRD